MSRETRAGKYTHPALALIRAGDAAEAIRLLEVRGDHPSALAVLRDAQDPLRAGWLLEGLAPLPPEDAAAASQRSETPVSVDVRRRA